jgi:hypothetical protein
MKRRATGFLILTAFAIFSLIAVLIILMTRPAWSAELVCPPKRYFCWQVRAAAASFGEMVLESRARACGWTESQIAAARRCLK